MAGSWGVRRVDLVKRMERIIITLTTIAMYCLFLSLGLTILYVWSARMTM